MSNLKTLGSQNNLSNIPHMLRNLAAEIERGDEVMPRAVFVIGLHDGNTPPDLFHFGQEVSRLEEAGALYACAARVLQMDPTP